MEVKVIITYKVVCDHAIKILKIKESSQVRMSISEVMTAEIVSFLLYIWRKFGNIRKYLKETGCTPNMSVKSQLNRRLHKIKEIWAAILSVLSIEFSNQNINNEFIIDSFQIQLVGLQ